MGSPPGPTPGEAQRFGDRVHRLRTHLAAVYGDAAASDLVRSLLQSIAATQQQALEVQAGIGPGRWSAADVLLITTAIVSRARGYPLWPPYGPFGKIAWRRW